MFIEMLCAYECTIFDDVNNDHAGCHMRFYLLTPPDHSLQDTPKVDGLVSNACHCTSLVIRGLSFV